MATVTKVNQSTIIGLEETNQVGGAPMRYYVSDNIVPNMDKTMTPFGSLKMIPNKDVIQERWIPTRLNELDPSFRLPSSHGFLGAETLERSKVDTGTELRFGSKRTRCLKSEQMVTEQTTHRYDFISPTQNNTVGNKYSTQPLIITSNNFHTGNFGVNQAIPNYEQNGNNLVSQRAESSRKALIENNSFKLA